LCSRTLPVSVMPTQRNLPRRLIQALLAYGLSGGLRQM
jgi:hypothetical protein